MSAHHQAVRGCSGWPKDALRVTLGLIWAIDAAALEWPPALSYCTGPSRYTAGYCLERGYSWWWRLAELRRPAPLTTWLSRTAPPWTQPP
jgi:hypothetical protein